MSKALLTLRRLLFYRPLIVILLIIVYLVAALLLRTLEPDRRAMVVTVMGAFAAGGLTAVLTERVVRHSLAAGALGLPQHARTLRQAQAWFLGLFVGGPAVTAIILGASPLVASAILATAVAIGVALGMFGGWVIIAALAARFMPWRQWVALPAVQALAIVASAAMLWRWFQLPQRVERVGGLAPVILADARHERAGRREASAAASSTTEQAAEPAEEAQAAVLERQVAQLRGDLNAKRKLAAALGLAFGYSIHTAWRRVPYGIAVALLVVGVWHIAHGRSPEVLSYILMTVACCLTAVARLQTMVQRWMSTAAEQGVLHLTPHWPEARLIKQAVVGSTFLVQRGSVIVWAASSTIAALMGWVTGTYVLAGAVAVAGSSLALSGATYAVLARQRVQEWHVSTVALVLLVAAGALTIVLGFILAAAPSGSALAYGAACMVIPPLLALSWYTLAPLRLPVNVDPGAIRAIRWV